MSVGGDIGKEPLCKLSAAAIDIASDDDADDPRGLCSNFSSSNNQTVDLHALKTWPPHCLPPRAGAPQFGSLVEKSVP